LLRAAGGGVAARPSPISAAVLLRCGLELPESLRLLWTPSCVKGLEPGAGGFGAGVMEMLARGLSLGWGFGAGVVVEDEDGESGLSALSAGFGAAEPSFARRRARICGIHG